MVTEDMRVSGCAGGTGDRIAQPAPAVYDPRRAIIYQRLGIPTVATVAWTTDQVLRRLIPERYATEWTDATGTVMLVERELPEAWAGRKLTGLTEGDRFRLVSVSRGGEARLAGAELVGQEGDVLHLAARKDALDELEARLGDPSSAGHA